MKKIYLILWITISGFLAFAQTPRMILLEDFTSASSNASYLSAPGIGDILENYSNNIIAIQYHTAFSGIDTMNGLNPVEIINRVNTYGITGVPRLVIDGNQYTGQPDNLPYASIDSRSQVFSPFEILLDHQLSLNKDSVFVTVTIKATQVFNGNVTAYIAATERNIYFTTAPGTTPQTKFSNVFKKMLPDDAGNLLPSVWSINDSVLIFQSWEINGVYNPDQLELFCFVQDNQSKEIVQAAISKAKIPLDIGVVKTEFNDVLFPGSFFPKAKVKNFGTDVLTSCTISSRISNGPDSAKQWTGSIDPGNTGIINLAEEIAFPGNFIFYSAAQIPNGGLDLDNMNDSAFYNFSVIDTVLIPPLSENFEGNIFPPEHWFISNKDHDTTFYHDVYGGFGASSKGIRMPFFVSTRYRDDELYLPALNLSSVSNDLQLKFDYAYSFFNNGNAFRYDTLNIMVSPDSGNSWINVWKVGGADLATSTGLNTSFSPSNTEWKTDSVDLTSYSGISPFLVKFSGNGGRGNNLFLDNIAVDFPAAIIDRFQSFYFKLLPNPSNGIFKICFPGIHGLEAALKITDITGKMLINTLLKIEKNESQNVDLSFLGHGVYFASLSISGQVFTQKLIILH